MLIAIPVDKPDSNEALITTQIEANCWAVVSFEEGKIESIEFYKTLQEADIDWLDFVVLKNKFENYLNFMEEGSMVLVVRDQDSIEEIIEAFKFKELDEIGL